MTAGSRNKLGAFRAMMVPAVKAPRGVTTDASLPGHAAPDTDQLRNGRLLIQEEVGRGAMGFVVRATDAQLRRDLALKVSPGPKSELSREQVARFIEEAQITASTRTSSPCTTSVWIRKGGSISR